MAATTPVPVYFELSWAILSTIGLNNVLLGLLVIGITSVSPISLVPIVISAAGAIADGLCYYAFYAKHSQTPTLVAAGFADIMWLIQEAGLSFYSYLILIRVLRSRTRRFFILTYWSLILIITAIRVTILVHRNLLIRSTPGPSAKRLQKHINDLHIGYFITIAVVEIFSAVFLLRVFAAAHASSTIVDVKTGSSSGSGVSLFKKLIRSTEIRMATLALVGITRAVTYSFQQTAQSATGTATQVDRFAYTLECMFPIVMMIDIMASKLHFSAHLASRAETVARSRANTNTNMTAVASNAPPMPSTPTWATRSCIRTNSNSTNDEGRPQTRRQSFIRLHSDAGAGNGLAKMEVLLQNSVPIQGLPMVLAERELEEV